MSKVEGPPHSQACPLTGKRRPSHDRRLIREGPRCTRLVDPALLRSQGLGGLAELRPQALRQTPLKRQLRLRPKSSSPSLRPRDHHDRRHMSTGTAGMRARAEEQRATMGTNATGCEKHRHRQIH